MGGVHTQVNNMSKMFSIWCLPTSEEQPYPDGCNIRWHVVRWRIRTEAVSCKMTWRFRNGFTGYLSPERWGEGGKMREGRKWYRQRSQPRQSQVKLNVSNLWGAWYSWDTVNGGGGMMGNGTREAVRLLGAGVRPWWRSRVDLILLARGRASSRELSIQYAILFQGMVFIPLGGWTLPDSSLCSDQYLWSPGDNPSRPQDTVLQR